MTTNESTRNLSLRMTPAQVCQEKGWAVGTRIKGDEGYGETVIQITAIGEKRVLARQISHKGQPQAEREATWTLAHRDWEPA